MNPAVLCCLAGLWIGTVGFGLSLGDVGGRWFILNSISIALSSAITLHVSFRWRFGDFNVSPKRAASIFVIFFLISTFIGYALSWGGYGAFVTYPLIFAFTAHAAVFFGIRVACSQFFTRTLKPATWMVLAIVIGALLIVVFFALS